MKNLSIISIIIVALLGVSLPTQANEQDRVFIVYDSSNGLATNSSEIVMCTAMRRIMVSTRGHINFFDGAGFTHIDPKPSDLYPLPGYMGSYQVYYDLFNHLWIKNDRMMTCLNMLTETFVSDIPAWFKQMGITKPILDFFGDSVNNVWFLSGKELFSPAVGKTIAVHSPVPIQDIDVYENRIMLMFHIDGSVGVYDYHSGRFLYQDQAFDDADRDRFTKTSEICLMGNQYYQLRNGDGEGVLLRYDIGARRWDQLLKTTLKLNALCPRGNLLYIGTDYGYMVYDTLTGTTEHIKVLKLSKGRTQHAYIQSMAFDYQGGLWIGTEKRGLLYAKPFPTPFKSYFWDSPRAQKYIHLIDKTLKTDKKPLPRKVNCIYNDSRGWKWTGTFNGLEMENHYGRKQSFTHKDGLTNDVVHSIVEDKMHNLWVTTSYGMCQVQIKNGEVTHIEPYINQDNVPNETFLNGRAILDGDSIVMQALDHVLVFDPSQFHNEKFATIPLTPRLIRMSVNGNEIESGEKIDDQVVTQKAVIHTDTFNVNYNQNSVVVIFSALNYLRPIQTYYRLRVKGVPGFDDWLVMSYAKADGNTGATVDRYGLLRLPLLGLDPGTYRIEVQASFWPGIWNVEPYVWVINVEQPWWRTTGLYSVLGLLLIALLALNVWLYNRNMRLRLLRTNEEIDIIRHIKSFASRCVGLESEVITPQTVSHVTESGVESGMSEDFVEAMMHIVPYVNNAQDKDFTMTDLAAVSGIQHMQLYSLLSTNIDKSPRLLMIPLRLSQAAHQLKTTRKTVEEIAKECRFESVNFFISSFYHLYRQTPEEYRNS